MTNKLTQYDINFMDRGTTSVIRGLAILGIVLHHCSQYFDAFGPAGSLFRQSGYALTAVFFLLSGYGCYFSLKKYNGIDKNKKAIKPLTLWTLKHSSRIYFDFIIVFVTNLVLLKFVNFGYSLTTKEILYDIFTVTQPTWVSWYPKIQIFCYIVFAISFLLSKKHKELITFVISVIYISVVWKLGWQSMWYTSVLAFSIGAFFAKYLPQLKITKKANVFLFVISISLFGVLFCLQPFYKENLLRFLSTIVLCPAVVFFTGFFNLKSKILTFIGNMSFEIYLIHLMFLRLFCYMDINPYLAVILIIVISMVCGYVVNCVVKKFIKVIFK